MERQTLQLYVRAAAAAGQAIGLKDANHCRMFN